MAVIRTLERLREKSKLKSDLETILATPEGQRFFKVLLRELGTGKSRLEIARSMGLKFTTVKKLPIIDGIDAVRALLPRCWFSKDSCARGLEALKGYHKEFDSARQVFRKTPVHDSNSHGADAFRTMAVGLKTPKLNNKTPKYSYDTTKLSW
jgi:hypothetical protein